MGTVRGQPNLDRGPLPLRSLRDHDRAAILEALDTIRGRKALVLEADFAAPLGLVVEASALREHGVETFGVLEGAAQLMPQLIGSGVQQIVYLIHTSMQSVFAATRHVSFCQRSSTAELHFTWLLVPRMTKLASSLLTAAGLAADVTICALPLTWIPLDEDVLSLEVPGVVRALTSDGDVSSLHDIAMALAALQTRVGTFSRIKAKGPAACGVASLLGRMRATQWDEASGVTGAGVAMAILLDRTVDPITPWCTQLTYEGLLDEMLGRRCGQLTLGSPGEGHKVYGLNSSDAVFQETRGKFYLDARKWINERLRTIQQFRDQGMHRAEITALRGFVSELKEKFVHLPTHASLMEDIATRLQTASFVSHQKIEAGVLDGGDELAAIEDLIYCGEDPVSVLRLLCLQSTVQGGLPRKAFDTVRRDFLHAYGHQHLLTLGALQRAGLLERRERRHGWFAAAKDALSLLSSGDEIPGTTDPTDIHFTYAGYAPLSVRVVQAAVGPGGWAGKQATIDALPGPSIEVCQTLGTDGWPIQKPDRSRGGLSDGGPVDRAASSEISSADTKTVSRNSKPTRPVVLVVFIGGVTSAEIAALRFLSERDLVPCDFVVATTGVVTGQTLLQEFSTKGL